jgi:hypothetical protein
VSCVTYENSCRRYTKALDNIKLLRKERTQELKVDKERLTHYKSDKDKAETVSFDECSIRLREPN